VASPSKSSSNADATEPRLGLRLRNGGSSRKLAISSRISLGLEVDSKLIRKASPDWPTLSDG
jgi:hypothetical protein